MQTTLTIPDTIAKKINDSIQWTGGSIAGYAAHWASQIAMLPAPDQMELQAWVNAKHQRLHDEAFRGPDGKPMLGAITAAVLTPRRRGRPRRGGDVAATRAADGDHQHSDTHSV